MAGRNANAPVGANTAAEAVNEIEKIMVSSSVVDAINAASSGLAGGELQGNGTLEDAAKVIGEDPNRGNFFDPSLSQYHENLCIYFDPENSRVRSVPVGKSGATALVVTVPAGLMQADNTVVYNRPFNAYVSTFRKTIQLTDEVGEPVLDENMIPQVVDGKTNAVWEEMHATHNESELLRALTGRAFCCKKIKRGYGPSNFVTLSDGSRKAQGHKLTSLPLFEEI